MGKAFPQDEGEQVAKPKAERVEGGRERSNFVSTDRPMAPCDGSEAPAGTRPYKSRTEGMWKKKLVPEIILLLVQSERGGSLSGFPLTRKLMQTLYCSLPVTNTEVVASCF